MANSITNLYRSGYAAVNEVSRELVGMTRAVRKIVSTTPVSAGLNQPVSIPVVGPGVVQNIDSSNITPQGADRNIEPVQVDMSNEKKVSWHLTSEEMMALENPATQNDSILQDSIKEAMRALVNEIEASLCLEARNASRAVGTAGTSPFGTTGNMQDFSLTSKILNFNGCPVMNRRLVLNLDAWANLIAEQPSLWRVNEAGDATAQEYGMPPAHMFGFETTLSGGFVKHTKGAGTSYAINMASGAPIGTTVLTVDSGSDPIKQGDVITIADDTNRYIVAEAVAGGGTSVRIAAPGLLMPAANDAAITVGNDYTPNLAFHGNAIALACRPPASHFLEDAATESLLLMDKHSNLVFELAMYRQYRQVSMEIGICWGHSTVKPEHIALLLG